MDRPARSWQWLLHSTNSALCCYCILGAREWGNDDGWRDCADDWRAQNDSAKTPVRGYREQNGHRRCDVELRSELVSDGKFSVFVRQNVMFIENFSIGLRYRSDDATSGPVTLVRYNGPHGELRKGRDKHFFSPHIHRITEEEVASGSVQPQEKHREPTDRYSTLEQALAVFFKDIGVSDVAPWLPDLRQGVPFQ